MLQKGQRHEETQKENSLEALQELGKKYGVQVTDMAERGIRAIGILGVRRQDQQASKEHLP
jgi:hypothetical protein